MSNVSTTVGIAQCLHPNATCALHSKAVGKKFDIRAFAFLGTTFALIFAVLLPIGPTSVRLFDQMVIAAEQGDFVIGTIGCIALAILFIGYKATMHQTFVTSLHYLWFALALPSTLISILRASVGAFPQ